MEKNWIEKIEGFIIKAMNKGLFVIGYKYKSSFDDEELTYDFTIDNNINITICINGNFILSTPTGRFKGTLDLNRRNILTLDTLIATIEEYREDMAISEFDNFFNKDDESEKKISIDDLDSEDD